jgi:hypothetical protein
LLYRDRASTDEPLSTSRTGSEERLADDMTATVRSLFGMAAVEVTGAPRVRWWTWLTLGTGAAVLAGGAILGATSLSGDYATLTANSPADVDRIEASYSRARSRALWGNVLMGAGGVMLGVGGALLLIDLLGTRHEAAADHLDLAIAPSLQGGMLTLRHTSRSFL